MNDSKNKLQASKLLNWKSVIIGSIITFIGLIICFGGNYYLSDLVINSDLGFLFFAIWILTPVIAIFTVVYINKPIYKVGLLSGLVAIAISVIVYNIILYFILNFDGFDYTIIAFIEMTISDIISLGFLGIFGYFICKFLDSNS